MIFLIELSRLNNQFKYEYLEKYQNY